MEETLKKAMKKSVYDTFKVLFFIIIIIIILSLFIILLSSLRAFISELFSKTDYKNIWKDLCIKNNFTFVDEGLNSDCYELDGTMIVQKYWLEEINGTYYLEKSK